MMIEWATFLLSGILRVGQTFRIRRVVERGPDTVEIEADVLDRRPTRHIKLTISPEPEDASS